MLPPLIPPHLGLCMSLRAAFGGVAIRIPTAQALALRWLIHARFRWLQTGSFFLKRSLRLDGDKARKGQE